MLRISVADGLSATTIKDSSQVLLQLPQGEPLLAEKTVHVTQVTSHNEDCCRMLDRVARAAYVDMSSVPNTVDVLQAPAGGGKTQSNIDLASNLLRKEQVQKVLMVAFNKAAVRDGEQRTSDEPRIVWRTVDSLVWQLYEDEFKNKEAVDLDDAVSVARLGTRLLEMPLFPDEAEDFLQTLRDACTAGDPSRLRGDGLALYQAGLQGAWWSYSMLRIRALAHPAWTSLFNEYQTIIVDESQDLNIVMLQLLRQLHVARHFVYSLDRSQKLYSFMQCVNITDHLRPESFRFWKFYITFRHGPAVCQFVNDRCLPQYSTFSAVGAPDTEIHYLQDHEIVQGQHTWIVNSWYNILETADKLLNAGREVRIDAEKRDELLAAAQAAQWSKHDRGLFKRMSKHVVLDIMSRVQQSEVVRGEAEVYLTTPHGFKGLQSHRVRVSRCVMEARARRGQISDDKEHKIYVSVTRVRQQLYLPSKKWSKHKM